VEQIWANEVVTEGIFEAEKQSAWESGLQVGIFKTECFIRK
jgi:hypothetical protein